MSVGIQRLRDDADAIRQGALDKGEDAALVDQALAADEQRRHLLGDVDTAAGRAQAGQRAGRRGNESPRRATRTSCRRARSSSARKHRRGRGASAGRLEDRARRPAAAHPQPARPGRARGPARGHHHGPHLGRPAPHDAGGWERQPHWEIGEPLGMLDLAAGAKVAGSGFPIYRGAGAPAPASADRPVPRHARRRARHDRDLAAGRRQRRTRRAARVRSRTRKTRCTS